jgi:phosphoribosylformylglycinamidine synthase PurS subunit
MTQRVHVRVIPRTGLLDPQGQAVEHALAVLGFSGVSNVRIGKAIELTVDADSPAAAEALVRRMCEQLLANPVTEDFVIEVEAR